MLANNQLFASMLLFVSVAIALVWANSRWAETYFHFFHSEFAIDVEGVLMLRKDLHHWINDGLMSIFFFVVGLEIRKELIQGELSSVRKATIPILAALGGMIFPALIYLAFNWGGEYVNGWGIPMATDIAFALGAVAMVRKRFTSALIVFLTAVATVDDIGSVLVIGIFYTPNISVDDLVTAFIFLGLMYAGNRMGIRSSAYYAVLGLFGVWIAITLSGIHATIAGVLAAFTIPAKVEVNSFDYLERLKRLVNEFSQTEKDEGPLISEDRFKVVQKIKRLSYLAETPLQELEKVLKPVVQIFIIPVFALANAGIDLSGLTVDSLGDSVFLGVFFGLLVGKLLGITFATYIAQAVGIGERPAGSNWLQISSVALVGGIGFTMSLFIAELALPTEEALNSAKLGILGGSLLAAIGGILIANLSRFGAVSSQVGDKPTT
jgi:NhaA family Na+:H+ antiporter